MKIYSRIFMLAALLIFMLSQTAYADWDRHDGGNGAGNNWEGHEWDHNQHDEYWGGDIHRFYDHDFDRWRSGKWFHGFHEGVNGWWWVVTGLWYNYPAPLYPYPDPYVPPDVAALPTPSSPAIVVGPGSPPQLALPQYWYYCSDPPGYFPYVPHCNSPWRRMTATNEALPAPP